MPLPEDAGLQADGRQKVRRFRSYQLDLGQRLAAFREGYGVTQAEAARAVGARDHSAVSQWESGANVPDGMLRERLMDLVGGRRWPELRAAMLASDSDGLPERWDRGVRWYRRASRERRPRQTAGVAIATILDELRCVESAEALRRHYRERDGDRARAVVGQCGLEDEQRADVRRVENSAYGLRWLELMRGLRLDLRRSLVPQLPPTLLA